MTQLRVNEGFNVVNKKSTAIRLGKVDAEKVYIDIKRAPTI